MKPMHPSEVQKRISELTGINTGFITVSSSTSEGDNGHSGPTLWVVVIKQVSLDQSLKESS